MYDKSQLMRGTLEGCILKILSKNTSYGYEIVTTLLGYGFKDIKEGQKGNSRFTTMEEIKEQYKCVNEVETSEERELGGYEGKDNPHSPRPGYYFQR